MYLYINLYTYIYIYIHKYISLNIYLSINIHILTRLLFWSQVKVLPRLAVLQVGRAAAERERNGRGSERHACKDSVTDSDRRTRRRRTLAQGVPDSDRRTRRTRNTGAGRHAPQLHELITVHTGWCERLSRLP